MKGRKPWNLDIPMAKEIKEKLSMSHKGKTLSEETRIKIGDAHRGLKSWKWISDRTQLKDDHKDRGGQLHREWSQNVKNRDGWKCRIANDECSGRLESHHILGWRSHPELRYQLNNGITLCHYHHPRKREDENRLSPYFQELVLKGN